MNCDLITLVTGKKSPAVVFSFFSRKCALRDIFSVTNMIEDSVGRGGFTFSLVPNCHILLECLATKMSDPVSSGCKCQKEAIKS